jgi:hypothetical protein
MTKRPTMPSDISEYVVRSPDDMPSRHNGQMDDPTADAAELRRTMYISAFWFVGALLSGTVTTAMLIASGWRPYRLDLLPEIIWWLATAVSASGTVLLAWAGCPITKHGVGQESHSKSMTVRIGIVAFLAGIAVASVVELCSPVAHQ